MCACASVHICDYGDIQWRSPGRGEKTPSVAVSACLSVWQKCSEQGLEIGECLGNMQAPGRRGLEFSLGI